jgi:hypothetical protein
MTPTHEHTEERHYSDGDSIAVFHCDGGARCPDPAAAARDIAREAARVARVAARQSREAFQALFPAGYTPITDTRTPADLAAARSTR